MTNPEANIDQLIRAALNDEETQAFDDLGEQNIFEEALSVLNGRSKIITIMTVVVTFVMFGCAVYAGIQFFKTDPNATKTLIAWASGFLMAMIGVSMLKMWYWLEMERHGTIREIKRVELQLSHLARKLEERP